MGPSGPGVGCPAKRRDRLWFVVAAGVWWARERGLRWWPTREVFMSAQPLCTAGGTAAVQ
ncbi:hypothetical protein FMEAI12_4800019 [Parafrankia sp. Ea1.12]|nr:hypothetical protein FMEAI12_4800019 [Parafrankia sp. Ea1.12]